MVSGVGVTAAPEGSPLFWEYRAGDEAAFLTVEGGTASERWRFVWRGAARGRIPRHPFLSLCNNNAVRRAKTRGGRLHLEELRQTAPRQEWRGFEHTAGAGRDRGVQGQKASFMP